MDITVCFRIDDRFLAQGNSRIGFIAGQWAGNHLIGSDVGFRKVKKEPYQQIDKNCQKDYGANVQMNLMWTYAFPALFLCRVFSRCHGFSPLIAVVKWKEGRCCKAPSFTCHYVVIIVQSLL